MSVDPYTPHPDGPRLKFVERIRREIGPAPVKSAAEAQATIHRTRWSTDVLADATVVGRPAGSRAPMVAITADVLEREARVDHDGPRLDADGWALVADDLCRWTRARVERERATETPTERAHRELTEQRQRAARRADAERRRAQADADLAKLDDPAQPDGPVTVPEPERPTPWWASRSRRD